MQAIFLILLSVSTSPTTAEVAGVPAEAQRTIALVHAAAAARDFSTLRELMVQEFTWSLGYGADKSAEQAIDAWRKEPDSIAALQRVTGQSCARTFEQHVVCPPNAGVGFRAAFMLTPQGWRMTHFLAGD